MISYFGKITNILQILKGGCKLLTSTVSQWLPLTIWLPTFFKISSVFSWRKKLMQFWNDDRIIFVNYDFNWNIVVHQTSVTLLWTLYELARHPDLQEEIRAEISAARIASKGDVVQMLKMVPLIKGALKETLRYTNTFCSTMVQNLTKTHLNFCHFLTCNALPSTLSILLWFLKDHVTLRLE